MPKKPPIPERIPIKEESNGFNWEIAGAIGLLILGFCILVAFLFSPQSKEDVAVKLNRTGNWTDEHSMVVEMKNVPPGVRCFKLIWTGVTAGDGLSCFPANK